MVPLLRYIDFERMPAHFLESRVEPLGLLSMEQLIQARHPLQASLFRQAMMYGGTKSFIGYADAGAPKCIIQAGVAFPGVRD